MKHDSEIVRQLDAAEDTYKRSRLRTMERVALGLLLVAAALFAVARSQQGQHPFWGYLEAFAEAAMVGAIADWFAVVALFRHPLGIPLWHTAIIPNSKASIGTNLGSFVENHFVTEENVAERIRQADLAGRAGEWLRDPANAAQVGKVLTGVLAQALDKVDDESMRERIRDFAAAELGKLDFSGLAGGYLDTMIGKGAPQALLDPLLEKLITWLGDENNHETVGDFLVQCFSIENAMVKSMLLGYTPKVIGSLREQAVNVRMDRAHPLRARVDSWLAESALRLKADPEWKASVARYQVDALHGEELQATLGGIWDAIRARVQADLAGPEPVIAATVRQVVQECGRLLEADEGVRGWVNAAIESGSAALVRRYRGEVGKFIEKQLEKWTKEEMSSRIELAIGRDLQFIRINGTLVGGLVGILIHAVVVAA
ncbi:DUF445 family protein [Massilia dura]|uniref:DUF445 family protein n=1 Tax=Pseudoduganella dura TaxID=321982 RepID=A0A6I3XCQ9_9BURK|nr:DUF445 domain-containing protein [Pseudoduganella dura]MUI12330.1 DUF445 family protein [Pseudoduganella dura]GGX99527.1 membrane protein [Pseudoduganella dura]